MNTYFYHRHYNECNCLSILGLRFNHVSKRGPWCLLDVFFFTETSLWYNCEGKTRIIAHCVKISHKFVFRRTWSLFVVSALPTFIETRYILSCSSAGPVCLCIQYVDLVIIVPADDLVPNSRCKQAHWWLQSLLIFLCRLNMSNSFSMTRWQYWKRTSRSH